jgi:NADH-quinone oxidoreductase subunit L
MALALIVLAIGSVIAGFIGVPHALGGSNRIEAFLEPSFQAHATAPANPEFQTTPFVHPATEPAAGHEETAAGDTGTELTLMALSVGIAFAGIGIAAYFWLRNRAAAASMARSLSGPYKLLLNKYYVDEMYDVLIVHPIVRLSTFGLWKGADAALIDGAVNGVGDTVRGASSVLRRLQTGSVRAYAASLFFGVVMILGWYLWR